MAEARIKITVDDSQAKRALGDLASTIRGLAGIAFSGGIAAQLIQIADQAQQLTNKLKFVTGSTAEANAAFDILAATAQKTGSSIGGTVDLFTKLAASSTFAGSSTESLAEITENFNKTLQISGTSGAGAASALYQFAQAVQKGSLNGDEFRTILETNGYFVRQLEKALGVTRTELMSMASNGVLSMDKIAKALYRNDQISKDYAKTNKTLSQAFTNIETAVTKLVKKFDDATGISQAFVSVLEWLTNNEGALIGAVVGLTAAVAALLIPLIPAATAMTILTGGAVLVGAVALGTAIGLAAQEAGLIGKKAEEANKALEKGNETGKKGLVINKERNKLALDLDKALKEQIADLEEANKWDAQATGIKNNQLEIEKAVAAEKVKYLKTGESMLAKDEQSLRAALAKKLAIEDQLATSKKLLDLQSAITIANEQDQGARQVTAQLEQYRLSVSQQEYELKKATVKTSIEESIQAQTLAALKDRAAESQAVLNSLTIKDLNQREVEMAVAKERLKLGYLFTAEMEKQLRASIQNEQLARQSLALEQQRSLLAGQAMPQNREEQIKTATGAIGRLDPRLAAEQQYLTEKAALAQTEFQSEDQKNQMLRALELEHQQKLHEIRKSMAEQQLRQAGVTNAGIIDATKRGMDNIKMIQQGGIQAAMGTADQLGFIFGQLGTFNKRAFEAAKAFNIANAIMNTYMGATKALAMYPPPFNFVLAAGVVAAGLAQVAQIRSQQYSGRQLGGPVMGGKPYLVGENGPELFTPNTTGSVTRNSDIMGGGQVNVNFTIVANDTRGFDELLTSRQTVIKQIISDAMLERGQRSMV